MVLVGEVKEFAPARSAQKLIIKHMPGFVFLLDDSLYRRMQVRLRRRSCSGTPTRRRTSSRSQRLA